MVWAINNINQTYLFESSLYLSQSYNSLLGIVNSGMLMEYMFVRSFDDIYIQLISSVDHM